MSNRCPKCVRTHIVGQHLFLLLSVYPLSRPDAFFPPASHCFLGTDSQIPGAEMKRSEEKTRDYSPPPPSPSPCAPHKDFVGRVRQRLYRKLILSRHVYSKVRCDLTKRIRKWRGLVIKMRDTSCMKSCVSDIYW